MRQLLLDRRGAYVLRWHHRPTVWKESLAEHHSFVARTAYILAWLVIRHKIWGSNVATMKHIGTPSEIAVKALFHDEQETLTGDVPGSAKVMFAGAREAIDSWEAQAIPMLFPDAPQELRTILQNRVLVANDHHDVDGQIIKYADDLSALAYLEDQVHMGNRAVEDVRDSVLGVIARRDWYWLQELRKLYPDLP